MVYWNYAINEAFNASSRGQAQRQESQKHRRLQRGQQEARQTPSRYQPYPVVSTHSQERDGRLSLPLCRVRADSKA